MVRDRLVQASSIIVFLVVWAFVARQIVSTTGDQVLPGPAQVWPEIVKLTAGFSFTDPFAARFAEPLLQSLVRTAVGFATGFVFGVAIGIASAKLRWFAVTLTPLINAILFASTLVIIYLGIVILGNSLFTIAVIGGLVVAPNVAIYMRDVMHDLDRELLDMADSYRVFSWQRIKDVYLPYLIPPMLAASRIGFSMSWKVILLTEVFGFPGGLGFQIRIAYGIFNLPVLLAWLAIFVVVLLLIEQLIRITERAVVRWQ